MAQGDKKELAAARAGVDAVERELGERGAVWREDGAPDLNRRFASQTLYADWFADLGAAD